MGGGTVSAQHRRDRRIAVVGAGCYLGRRLIEQLLASESCADLLAIDQTPPAGTGAPLRAAALDLTAADAAGALIRWLPAGAFDTVVDLVYLDAPAREPAWAHELVSIGTLQLLNACAAAAVEHVVAVSSTMCYGAQRDNPALLTEQHPLRGAPGCRWIDDQVDVEHQLQAFSASQPRTTVTTLRLAPLLGPGIDNYWCHRFTAPIVHTLLGFDPLLQFLHPEDALTALQQAIEQTPSGAFNIVPHDAIALSRALAVLGRRGLPLPSFAARSLIGALNNTQLTSIPPELVDYLRYGWVADGARAADQLRFAPRHDCADALRGLARES